MKEIFEEIRCVVDGNGHWYILPIDMFDSFYSDLEQDVANDGHGGFVYSTYFEQRYGDYRVDRHILYFPLYRKTTV